MDVIKNLNDYEILKYQPGTIKSMKGAVRAIYYKRMANMKEKTLKVVVTGDTGAGKSSLITSFV